MNVICLEEAAFYALVEQVVARLKEKHGVEKDKWISDEQAMQLLNIRSKTTLQCLRDTGKIRFSQPQKKIILYDRDSINEYLEKILETLLTMEETDKINSEQLKGFNDGYLIAQYEPELSEKLSKIKAVSPRIVGMQQGREQFLKEQIKERLPSWLKDDRFDQKETTPSKNKDKGIEPER